MGLIAYRARESLGVRLIAIAIPNTDRSQSTFVAAAGDGHERVLGSSVGADSTTGTVLLARRALTIDDPTPAMSSGTDSRLRATHPQG
jgi:hypothetical protein